MKLSYNWLQTYFEEMLPNPEKIAELFTFHAYEIEGIEKVEEEGDYIFDIDVLPNRASDSLCHRGVARELAGLLGVDITERAYQSLTPKKSSAVTVHVEEPALCKRYIAKVLDGVSIDKTPAWLEKRLTAIGERSINGIVDVTNFVLFDMGQPLHVFDLDKIEGGEIHIRKARKGETITTLDGTDVSFTGGELIIADARDPIAIAGVKGGKKAGIDETTSRVVLEAAHFHPATVRKTARKLGILTDASKRFENEITMHWAEEGIERATALITDLPSCEGVQVGENVDIYETLPKQYVTGVSVSEVNTLLGTQMLSEEVERILTQARLPFEQITNPAEKISEKAVKYVGAPYRFGASVLFDAPEEFDCSSFTVFIYSRAGITIPRRAIDQFVFGEAVEEKDIQPGDIVFAVNENPKDHTITLRSDGTEVALKGAETQSVEFLPGTEVAGGVSHNGIYIGDGKVVHAHPEKGVVVELVAESDKFTHIVGYRRIKEAQDERYAISVPEERLDIRIPADVIEEVGRLYGYRNIDSAMPKDRLETCINKKFFYTTVVRNVLTDLGFSEVYTYAFQKTGKRELANPLAKDRAFLRENLSDSIATALDFNERHAPLLEGDDVRIFEIGTVFSEDAEHLSLALGARIVSGKKKEQKSTALLEDAKQALTDALGVSVEGDTQNDVLEINFSTLFESLPQTEQSDYESVISESSNATYTPISPYPFVLRDVSAWTPDGTTQEEFASLITEHAGELLAKDPECFDTFEKNGRVSYAFNLVFQSQERTLTDEEVNAVMDDIYKSIEAKGWEPR